MNKNMIKSAVLSLAAFSILSCTKDIEQKNENISERHHVTLTAASGDASAEQDGTSTKVMFAGKTSTIYWQNDDRIAVQAEGTESLYPLSLESRSANMQSAVFSGEIEGELGEYAVYPYNEGHKISGTTLTYHLPSEYTTSVDTDWVASADKIDASKLNANLALLAKISKSETGGGTSAIFNHLCGLLCIKIDKMPSTACTLTITADKKICGDFTVDLTDSQPEIESDEASSTDNVVTVNTSGGIYNNPCVYYIPMPIGEYNVTVELSYALIKGKENGACTAAKKVEIGRREIKRVSITQSTMYKGGYKIIEGHRFIDLGLPSGLLWAETNVGAELPADFGNFYAWGETSVKEPSSDGYMYYKSENYKYYEGFEDPIYTFSKYNSGGSMLTLDTSDDAAYTNWTTKCWTPTKDQAQELIDNTTVTLDATRKNSNGVTIEGAEFKSKTNDNSIFLPYNGIYERAYHRGYSGCKDGSYYGRYWTNNLIPEKKDDYIVYSTYTYQEASTLNFGGVTTDTDNVYVSDNWRFFGLGVRPVANAN